MSWVFFKKKRREIKMNLQKILILLLGFIFVFSNFVFAEYPDSPYPDWDYLICKNKVSGDIYLRVHSSERPCVKYSEEWGKYINVAVREPLLLKNNTWVECGSINGILELSDYSLIYSTVSIYNSDGTVFFSVPKTVQEVVEQETGKIIPDLVGKTKTILLVGFGILSALVLIRLLTVYFRHFLNHSM
jgi:hypothetical protein